MSAREKSPASESSSSATPPPIGETAPPDATPSSGTANAGASGSAQAVPGAAPPGAFVMPPGMAMPPGMQFLPYFPQPAAGGTGGDSNDPNAPAQPQQMMIHPAFIPQMYSYSYPGMMAAGMKLKRRQVKNACTNCQKACKKCDDERPCPRCVKYGIADECQDSVRKERRKGIKRGSYKKKGESEDGDTAQQPAFMPYPAQLYSQWAAAAMSAAGAAGGKPGETPSYYPYFIPVPQPGASGSGEASTSGEGGTAAANAIAANPYFSQMYYGGYPPGYPVPPGYGTEAATGAGSSKSAASNTVKSEEEEEEESEDELEEEEEEEPEESPKRKSSKKKRRGD